MKYNYPAIPNNRHDYSGRFLDKKKQQAQREMPVALIIVIVVLVF